VTPRCVRVVTDNAAVDRAFDYELTDSLDQIGVGDRVRVDFNNRSLRGWVTGEVGATREMKPVKKWLGLGPPPEMMGLLEWASQRWCAPLSRFLLAASPGVIVRDVPRAPEPRPLDPRIVAQAHEVDPGVVLVSPTHDPLALILYAHQRTRRAAGSLLVLVPTEAWAQRLRGRLEQRGCDVAQGEGEWDRMRAGWPIIVGARGTALAPTPHLRAAVVIDADDEAYRSESSPTWDAATLLVERCRRDNAPLWLTSVAPSPTLLSLGPAHSWGDVASGWPHTRVLDRREADPHDGVLARPALEAAHRALSTDEPVAVVVILQRLGHGRLFACRRCGELARCEVCGQAEVEVGDQLACADEHEQRPNFCRACGATNLKKVRVGVSTLARDICAQLSQPVDEVTAASKTGITARVVVGTEAVFGRVRRCSLVIFVDFDQYLLAPRESARRAALTAVAKAGRLVGSRREGRGEVVVQTRRHDEVIDALVSGDVSAVINDDAATAKMLGLPPFGARAYVSGEAAQEFVAQLDPKVVRVRHVEGTYVLSAPDVDELTRVVRETPRPGGRMRLEVF
jgi:primosomal protein N' (replication factor Y)